MRDAAPCVLGPARTPPAAPSPASTSGMQDARLARVARLREVREQERRIAAETRAAFWERQKEREVDLFDRADAGWNASRAPGREALAKALQSVRDRDSNPEI